MISFQSVGFVFQNGTRGLHDVTLEIGEGITAIIGANGAGKTTLVRHMNGLLVPKLGNVFVNGQNTRDATVAQLSRMVGILFQNSERQLFSNTVEEEISYGLKNFGLRDDQIGAKVDEVLSFFDLSDYRGKSPLTLSGGEKKMLCLAVVLAWEPDFLVLDEPTIGQDSINKERIEALVRRLASKRKGIIIISHDVEFLWNLQPRVIAMSNGSILADGKASHIFSKRRIIQKTRIVRPQLLELSTILETVSNPFSSQDQAVNYLKDLMNKSPLKTSA
ncbi:MAG: ABC transporter ATP-binding protein [Thaumarchaeota archaeon]|nr:ABC transporter ATP-binding protein [Nitrososphaerota archaeon]